MKIYNTLSQQKEEFIPINPGQVNIYVCGMTVYDYCHLGHARMLVSFDMIVRYLRFHGFAVNYVRNITDIDDKILNRARDNGELYTDLTERFIRAMHEDEAALSVAPPDAEPRATQHIEPIIDMIQTLIGKEYAYRAANGDVYFAVNQFPDYGKLSNKKLDELLEGARIEVGELKKDPRDFALWKAVPLPDAGSASLPDMEGMASGEGLTDAGRMGRIAGGESAAGESAAGGSAAGNSTVGWDSPWGYGRPGWHIECSAMSTCSLGNHFDIHGGGSDLQFPHHENEIAQSECATGEPYANYWMHNGPLRIDDEKMAKSLGNFLTVREVLKAHDPEVVRHLLIASHYRSPINYSDASLQLSRKALERMYLSLQGLDCVSARTLTNSRFEKSFRAAMDDDFNTPDAFAVLFEMVTEINRLKKSRPDQAAELGGLLIRLGGVLGLLQSPPEAFLKGGGNDTEAIDTEIDRLVAARDQARADKDWAQADAIRERLTAMKIIVEDGASGSTWRRDR